jgi:modified peptide precursor CbpA
VPTLHKQRLNAVATPLWGLGVGFGEGAGALGPWLPPQKLPQAFPPAAANSLAWPVNHRRKEDPYMAKKSTCKKPISIRYTCAPNGDQVGLSHYLMAEAKKAK